MKYIFCIVALLIQPFSAWLVFHKQDKRKAALKMPMLFYSIVYLVVQVYVFVKFCMKFPENYQMWSYLIQAAILIAFVLLELGLFAGNRYIGSVETREQNSIRDFKGLIKELEICRVNVSDGDNQKCIDALLEKMRYTDPVSSQAVEQENNKIHEFIAELNNISEHDVFAGKCEEIVKQLEIRRIKNTKERG